MKQVEIENPEFQFLCCVVGALTMDANNADRLFVRIETAGVRDDWFRDPRYKRIFEETMSEYREFARCDPFKLVNRIKNEPGLMDVYEDLVDNYTTTVHLEYYAGELKNRYIHGSVHKATMQFLRDTNECPENIVVLLEEYCKKLVDFKDSLYMGESQMKQLGEFIEESVAKKERLHQERFVNHNWRFLDGLPLPWDCLNQYYTGLKTGLHVVAALASAGKSTFAADLSVFWNERGIKHGFVCIDMADEQLADRYPCIIEQVSLAKLNFGGSRSDVDRFKRGYESAAKSNNVWITEADDAKTISELTTHGVKSLGWKAVIIDYIQLVSPDEKAQMPEYTKVQKATQAIKRLAKKLKIPVVCLAQLSRQAQKDLREKGVTPDLDALGDSAEIARAAASVLMLYRNDDVAKYWKANPPTQLAFGDKHDRMIACGVIKQGSETSEEEAARRNGQVSLAKTLRPMWLDLIKNQQGGRARLPFVMYPSYFLLRPGNHKGESMEVTVEGKQKTLPIQQFEQLIDDWTYTPEDWILEMTNAMPRRGFKLMGETYEQLSVRLAEAVKEHPEVRHFVRHDDGSFEIIEIQQEGK